MPKKKEIKTIGANSDVCIIETIQTTRKTEIKALTIIGLCNKFCILHEFMTVFKKKQKMKCFYSEFY